MIDRKCIRIEGICPTGSGKLLSILYKHGDIDLIQARNQFQTRVILTVYAPVHLQSDVIDALKRWHIYLDPVESTNQSIDLLSMNIQSSERISSQNLMVSLFLLDVYISNCV
jgi:hypothetical protein